MIIDSINNIEPVVSTETPIVEVKTELKPKPYKLEFIDISTKGDCSNHTYQLKINNLYRATLTRSPTGDCQTYSIGNVCEILQLPGYMDILKEINLKADKKQLLVNIVDGTRPNDIFKEIFKDNIVIHQLYQSTNGTMMNMYLVKTQVLRDYKSEYK